VLLSAPMHISAQVSERIADTGVGLAVGSWTFGVSIGQINEYLQAISFIVGMIAAGCAARYYYVKAREKNHP